MKINNRVVTMLMSSVVFLSSVNPIFAAGIDINVGTASDEVEHYIEVGRRLVGATKYVYGGGHSNWDVQKEYNLPLEVDSSSFVAWTLYKGMGIDMGKAPIASQFKNYFEEVAEGDLSTAVRGDIVVSDNLVEIYLGQDEEGKHLSLAATDKENGITVIETNWGRGLEGVSVLRPSIEDAKEGKNGLTYVEEAIFNEKDLMGIGGDQITIEGEYIKPTTKERSVEEQLEFFIKNMDSLEELGRTSGGIHVEMTEEEREERIQGEKDRLESLERAFGEGSKKEGEDSVDSEGEEEGGENSEEEEEYTSLFTWLDPIVDFNGVGETHTESEPRERRVDGNTKGLKGNKGGIFTGFFGR